MITSKICCEIRGAINEKKHQIIEGKGEKILKISYANHKCIKANWGIKSGEDDMQINNNNQLVIIKQIKFEHNLSLS